MGLGDDVVSPKIPVHQFVAVMGEYGIGAITQQEAQAIVDALSGAPLSPSEVSEAGVLLATVNNAGSATAKLARVSRIDRALLLAEQRVAGYSTPAEVKNKLGVT